MSTLSEKIQAVIKTLEMLTITATYDNLNKMLGCLQTLIEIRDDLKKEQEIKTGEEPIGNEETNGGAGQWGQLR